MKPINPDAMNETELAHALKTIRRRKPSIDKTLLTRYLSNSTDMVAALILAFCLAVVSRLARKRTHRGRWVHVRHIFNLQAKPGRLFTPTRP